jgi:hypothetical protein
MQQQRFDEMESSVNAFKSVYSNRIKKGFVIVNRIYEVLGEIKQNVNLYRENIGLRRGIINDTKLEDDRQENPVLIRKEKKGKKGIRDVGKLRDGEK